MREFSYEILLNKLATNEALSFSRFGDGEFNAIFRDKRSNRNCDGHTYFPDMGDRLMDVLKSSPDYYVGLQNLAYRQRQEQIDEIDVNWCKSDILHRASIKGKLNEFFEVLKDKKVLIVGASHMAKFDKFAFDHLEILSKNCWLEYDATKLGIEMIIKDYDVVLYAASMMTNVLIDDLHHFGITQIDIGSVLDPYCQVQSRSYHKNLKI